MRTSINLQKRPRSLIYNHNKCSFSNSTVDLLGYTISMGTIKPGPERLRQFKELPLPRDINSFRCALRVFSHCSHWIAKYPEKVTHLIQTNSLPKTAKKAFEYLKAEKENAIVYSIDETVPITVDIDVSYHSIANSLNQSGRSVAFFCFLFEYQRTKTLFYGKGSSSYRGSLT